MSEEELKRIKELSWELLSEMSEATMDYDDSDDSVCDD